MWFNNQLHTVRMWHKSFLSKLLSPLISRILHLFRHSVPSHIRSNAPTTKTPDKADQPCVDPKSAWRQPGCWRRCPERWGERHHQGFCQHPAWHHCKSARGWPHHCSTDAAPPACSAPVPTPHSPAAQQHEEHRMKNTQSTMQDKLWQSTAYNQNAYSQ